MAGKRELTEQEVTGLKHLKKVLPLFARLRESGCERDKAGNRRLLMDQYCTLVLLFLFNPMIDSLRVLQQASDLKKVKRRLGVRRASLGSLSEATQVFDPELLVGIIGELSDQIPPLGDVSRGTVEHVLTAVDGTLCRTLVRLVEATACGARGHSRCGWRLHTQFEIDRSIPKQIDVTVGRNGGKTDEREVLRQNLEPGRCYVMDRWYAERRLFNQIHAHRSSYVCRVRDNSRLVLQEERELTAEDHAAGVLSDKLVRLSGSQNTDHPVRLVCVATTPHVRRGSRTGTGGAASDGVLRIATDLIDPPAEIIAAIYQSRWQIEVFFRFFKHVLGCRHLISQDQQGIEILAYCAIIACLLLALVTGRKPTKATHNMVGWYMIGLADEKELLAHLKKLKRR